MTYYEQPLESILAHNTGSTTFTQKHYLQKAPTIHTQFPSVQSQEQLGHKGWHHSILIVSMGSSSPPTGPRRLPSAHSWYAAIPRSKQTKADRPPQLAYTWKESSTLCHVVLSETTQMMWC